jgi:hypothetical protein
MKRDRRGTSTERGYGLVRRRLRERLLPFVLAGAARLGSRSTSGPAVRPDRLRTRRSAAGRHL